MAIDERVVDREAFEEVATRLENGEQLTLEHIGDVFLKQFWMMLLFMCMDAKDASRAIDGAMRQLRYEAALKDNVPVVPETLVVEA